jgi:hypothetical protein
MFYTALLLLLPVQVVACNSHSKKISAISYLNTKLLVSIHLRTKMLAKVTNALACSLLLGSELSIPPKVLAKLLVAKVLACSLLLGSKLVLSIPSKGSSQSANQRCKPRW